MWRKLVVFVIYGLFIAPSMAMGGLAGAVIGAAAGAFFNLSTNSFAPIIIQLIVVALFLAIGVFLGSVFYRLYLSISSFFDYYMQH